MENQEYKDELSKEEKEEQLLIRSEKAAANNLAKGGFMTALAPYGFMLFISFISSCILYGGGVDAYYRLQNLYIALRYICLIIGIVGLVISILAYKKTSKDDTKAKVFSALGMGFGSLSAWLLATDVIYRIIQAIFR
ncbi:MAG: hypothetical protein K2J13_04055 [Clostridia bacterium]|nr:hypothetical protein [Clostridia bacterium]